MGGERGTQPPTPPLLIIHSTGECDVGRMRYAPPAPRLLIIHSAGEWDAGGNEVCNPTPPFINYSLTGRTGCQSCPSFFSRLFTHLSEGMRVGTLQRRGAIIIILYVIIK